MKLKQFVFQFAVTLAFSASAISTFAQMPTGSPVQTANGVPSVVKQSEVERQMQALASDAMRGRGSATDDEFAAALFLASEFRRFGIEPAGNNGGYLQHIAASVRRRGTAEAITRYTVNVVGIIRGSDAQLSKDVILLSAHLDHLGVGRPVNSDAIYNGADDDASGCVAVLQLAQALAGTHPKRTIVFALFGSEEMGGYGARYFLEHPPMPLESIAANLEFEMLGRPDPKVAPHTLWLTGYDLSDLGAQLAAHGARLVADPHPEQHFFQRSDNYTLARRGIIAHTISSFGLHKEYHQPNDDLAHIDFAHLTDAINSMIEPIRWLANSDFRPKWAEGKNPQSS
jgi:hypothetical protein